MKSLLVVIGDTHARLQLAGEGIERIEEQTGRAVDQVFSVGDLGLFIDESDWTFLTGPKQYRHPELSPAIFRALEQWRWPLSMIAGNHEPFNRLRNWKEEYFLGKVNYTNAGMLTHSIDGLQVAGLSGIYHPEELSFISSLEAKNRKLPRAASWPEMVELAENDKISRNRLTYYKQSEVDAVMALPKPQLLLLHDWPIDPPHLAPGTRPERTIVEALKPDFVCCGHHHTSQQFEIGATQGFALNIIASRPSPFVINRGWAALFEWDGATLSFLGNWPS